MSWQNESKRVECKYKCPSLCAISCGGMNLKEWNVNFFHHPFPTRPVTNESKRVECKSKNPRSSRQLVKGMNLKEWNVNVSKGGDNDSSNLRMNLKEWNVNPFSMDILRF